MARKPRPVEHGKAGMPCYPNFREYVAIKARLRRMAKVGLVSIGISACGGLPLENGEDSSPAIPPLAADAARGSEYIPPDTWEEVFAGGLDVGEERPDSAREDSSVNPRDGGNEGEADQYWGPAIDGMATGGVPLPGDSGCCSQPYAGYAVK